LKKSRAVVIPDMHIPLQDDKAVNVVHKAIKMIKPDKVILLGDLGEWESVSPWKYRGNKKRPPLEFVTPLVDEEALEVNKYLNRLDKVCKDSGVKEKYFMMGNHEIWLDYFVGDHPYLPQYLPTKLLRLKERDYKVIKYGGFLKIGKLSFYHGGHYAGIYHLRRHLQHLGVNIMYAHYHDMSRDSITRLDGAIAGFCIGCLKKCDHDSNTWLRGRAVNWGHGFAVVDWDTNGVFRVDMVDITNGKTSLWGKQING
jgi:hypothetical protein